MTDQPTRPREILQIDLSDEKVAAYFAEIDPVLWRFQDLIDARRALPKPLLHPAKLRQLYFAWVNDTCDALTDEDRHAEAVAALRSMIDSIVLTPEQGSLGIVVKGDLAVMLAAGYPKQQAAQREQLSLVAGACNKLYRQLCWAAA